MATKNEESKSSGILDAIPDSVKQQLISESIKALVGLFGELLARARKPRPPVVVIDKPTPVSPGIGGDDFPDDHIPTPTAEERDVATVELKLARVQYNRQRFPEQYTEANPQGLYSPDAVKAIQDGSGTMNFTSKFWLDLTARDQHGKEFLRDAVLAYGLAFETEHHCGGAYIQGHGQAADGGPKPGYGTSDTDAIGNGITAWLSSLGFLHQMKAHGEGSFECWGKVNGVESNHFTIRVS